METNDNNEETAPKEARAKGPLWEDLQEIFTDIEKLMQHGERRVVPSCFKPLEALTHGMLGGEVAVIASRPGIGKSSFLMNELEYLAVDCKRTVLLFMCEAPRLHAVQRLFFSRSHQSYAQLAEPPCNISAEAMRRMSKAVKDIRPCNLIIDDTTPLSIEAFCAKARQVHSKHPGLSVIGIDYLQLMRAESRRAQESGRAEMEEIMLGLKSLAKELDVAILVASQMNCNDGADQPYHVDMYTVADISHGDVVEQTADIVALLCPSSILLGEPDYARLHGNRELLIVKNRRGPSGRIPLFFEPDIHRFSTCPEVDDDEMF